MVGFTGYTERTYIGFNALRQFCHLGREGGAQVSEAMVTGMVQILWKVVKFNLNFGDSVSKFLKALRFLGENFPTPRRK